MYSDDLKKLTKENTNFRKVLYTGDYSQIVVMSIPIGGEIGDEVHVDTDQIFYIVDGEAEAIIDMQTHHLEEHDVLFVKAGEKHNIKNSSDEALKLYTIYSPPHHPDGIIHVTKADAEMKE